jgi:hypothetical protein
VFILAFSSIPNRNWVLGLASEFKDGELDILKREVWLLSLEVGDYFIPEI